MKTIGSEALPLKVVHVWVEGMPDGASVLAYATTAAWNGFVQPFLPLDSGKELMKWIPELRYDARRDAFLYEDDEDTSGERDHEFKAETVAVNGEEIKAYPIGAGYWTWYLA